LSAGGHALIRLLLSPPEPFLPGDSLPDEVIVAGVWPNEAGRGGPDVDGLVQRLRRDLLRVGIDPTRVLDRRLDRGTRFCLTPRVALTLGTPAAAPAGTL